MIAFPDDPEEAARPLSTFTGGEITLGEIHRIFQVLPEGNATAKDFELREKAIKIVLSLDPETQALTREFVAVDPLYFREPYTGSDVVHPSNVPYQPDVCDDRSVR